MQSTHLIHPFRVLRTVLVLLGMVLASAGAWAANAGDTTPPVTTAGPSISSGPSVSTVSISVTVNEGGTGYWLVQPSSTAAPTVAALASTGTSVTLVAATPAVISITGLQPNTSYKFYFVAQDVTPNLQTAVSSVAFATSVEVIPTLAVSINGVSTMPPIVDLSGGLGPVFVPDMVSLLSSVVGSTLSFVEQNAQGAVVLSGYSGGNLAFIPHSFQATDSRPNGVYPVGNGQYQVVRNGQSLVIAPALVRLDQLAALYPGIRISVGVNGVLTAILGSTTYVVLPGIAVQQVTSPAAASLTAGVDGVLRFVDTAGNSQVLMPAVSEPATLRSNLQALDTGASLLIQLDGTASLVYKGARFTMVPDITITPVPANRAGQRWWQDSATRYWMANLQTLGTAQGLFQR
jgi:hypothetical protein